MFFWRNTGVSARVYQPWDGDLWKLLVVRCKHRFHHRYRYSHGHAKAETGEGRAELHPDSVLVQPRSQQIQQKGQLHCCNSCESLYVIVIVTCTILYRDHRMVRRQRDGNPNMIVWAHHIFHQDLKCRADLRAGKTCQKNLAKVSVGTMDSGH